MKKESTNLWEKSKRSLNSAKDMFEKGDYDFSASRAYYAMFYISELLLLELGFTFSKHKEVIDGFYHQFVKTGKIDKRFHKTLNNAFELRAEGDYSFMDLFPRNKTEQLLKDAEIFINEAEKFIIKNH